MNIGRKTPKIFSGMLGSGLPVSDFDAYIDKPDSVKDNLAHLKPMIKAVSEMASTEGWVKYVRPFLEKQADSRKLIELIRKKEDPGFEAAKIEAFDGLLNYVNSLVKTAESLARIEASEKSE